MIAEIGLFALILALFVAAIQASVPPHLRLRAFAVLGAIAVGFLLFILTTPAPVNTNLTPSLLIDKPAPRFDLPPLYAGKQGFKNADLKGHVTLVNFFASWCVPCRAEHPALRSLAGSGITLVGINYKDKPENAQAFLAELGNPYAVVAADAEGSAGIDFGVYGVPESCLIDKNGVVRFRQPGALTPDVIRDEILPRAQKLK